MDTFFKFGVSPIISCGFLLCAISSGLGQTPSLSPDGRFIATLDSTSRGRLTLQISEKGIKGTRILWKSARGMAYDRQAEIIHEVVWAPCRTMSGDTLIAFSTNSVRYGNVTQPDDLYVFSAESGNVKLKKHFGLRWTQIIRFSPDARIVATIASTTPRESPHGYEKIVLYNIQTGLMAGTIYDSALTTNMAQTIEDFAFVSNNSLDIKIVGAGLKTLHVLTGVPELHTPTIAPEVPKK